MPAASLKEMRGVNNTQELAMRSFDRLKDIMDLLKERGLPSDKYENIKKCLDSSKLYLKTNFAMNLQSHSDIASHCITHSCSDGERSHYKKVCKGTHSKRCEHCDNIQTLLKKCMGLVNSFRKTPDKRDNYLEEDEFEEAVHDINLANDRIWQYRCHIIRTWVQNSVWNKHLENMQPHQAFVVSDWAMKVQIEISCVFLVFCHGFLAVSCVSSFVYDIRLIFILYFSLSRDTSERCNRSGSRRRVWHGMFLSSRPLSTLMVFPKSRTIIMSASLTSNSSRMQTRLVQSH